MSNYFDYILEESIPQDYEDPNDIYNEMDATMCEFDSYVQEGVGLKIAAGIGIAALLGGLIAVIVKCVSNKSSSSATKSVKKAEKALNNKIKSEGTDATISFAPGEWLSDIGMKKLGFLTEASIAGSELLISCVENLCNAMREIGESKESMSSDDIKQKINGAINKTNADHASSHDKRWFSTMQSKYKFTGFPDWYRKHEKLDSGKLTADIFEDTEKSDVLCTIVKDRRTSVFKPMLKELSDVANKLNQAQKRMKEELPESFQKMPIGGEGSDLSKEIVGTINDINTLSLSVKKFCDIIDKKCNLSDDDSKKELT